MGAHTRAPEAAAKANSPSFGIIARRCCVNHRVAAETRQSAAHPSPPTKTQYAVSASGTPIGASGRLTWALTGLALAAVRSRPERWVGLGFRPREGIGGGVNGRARPFGSAPGRTMAGLPGFGRDGERAAEGPGGCGAARGGCGGLHGAEIGRRFGGDGGLGSPKRVRRRNSSRRGSTPATRASAKRAHCRVPRCSRQSPTVTLTAGYAPTPSRAVPGRP